MGRDGALLSLKIGSSNMSMEDTNLLENLDLNQGSKMIQNINILQYSPPQ